MSRRASRRDYVASPARLSLETLIASPVACVVAPRSRLWSRLLSRLSPRLFSHVSCHICCPISGDLASRSSSRRLLHLSSRLSSRRSSHVSCHIHRHASGRPLSRLSSSLSTHLSSCVSTRFTSRLRHIARPAFRGLSHVSSTRVSRRISCHMLRHDFAISQTVLRATVKAIQPTQNAQRVQLRSQNAHRATARATRLAQSAQTVQFAISKCAPRHGESDPTRPKRADGSVCDLKMRTAPQRERFDQPKVRRRLSLRSPNAHRATGRATRPIKVLRLPRNLHESTAPATKSARKALKCCACHEMCTNSSKVLRLSRKMTLQRHAESSKCCACHVIRS